MSIRVTIRGGGLARIGQRLNHAANFLGRDGVRSLLQDAGKSAVAQMRANIDSFTPGDVADLKPATKIQKAREVGFVYPILRRTHQLYNSLRIRVLQPRGGGGWVMRLEFAGGRAGGASSAEIAEGHITGAGHLPVRDFTKLNARWRASVVDAVRYALRNRDRL